MEAKCITFKKEKKFSIIMLLMLVFSFTHQLKAQSEKLPEVKIGKTVLVNPSKENYPHFETHLVINPTDNKNIIITSMSVPVSGEGEKIKVYTSEDGGESWTHREMAEGPMYGVDPYLAFDKLGNTYLVYLPGFVRTSSNGGKSWSKPVKLPLGPSRSGEHNNTHFDYTKIIADNTESRFSGRIYVTAVKSDRLTPADDQTIFSATLMRSLDQGQSFSFPEHVLPGNLNYGQGTPGIFTDGTLIFPFMGITKAGLTEPLETGRLWITRSLDGGKSFETPRLVQDGFFGMKPDVAIDLSENDFRDRVYMTWSTGAKFDFNILLNWSDDKGITWIEPIVVNKKKQLTWTQKPAIAVNKDGILGMLWMDVSDDKDGNCFTPYFSYSKDGGKSIVNVPLFEKPICNNTEANKIPFSDSDATVFGRWSRGGDYYGIDSFKDGSFQLVWADSRSGVFQLYTTEITVSP